MGRRTRARDRARTGDCGDDERGTGDRRDLVFDAGHLGELPRAGDRAHGVGERVVRAMLRTTTTGRSTSACGFGRSASMPPASPCRIERSVVDGPHAQRTEELAPRLATGEARTSAARGSPDARAPRRARARRAAGQWSAEPSSSSDTRSARAKAVIDRSDRSRRRARSRRRRTARVRPVPPRATRRPRPGTRRRSWASNDPMTRSRPAASSRRGDAASSTMQELDRIEAVGRGERVSASAALNARTDTSGRRRATSDDEHAHAQRRTQRLSVEDSPNADGALPVLYVFDRPVLLLGSKPRLLRVRAGRPTSQFRSERAARCVRGVRRSDRRCRASGSAPRRTLPGRAHRPGASSSIRSSRSSVDLELGIRVERQPLRPTERVVRRHVAPAVDERRCPDAPGFEQHDRERLVRGRRHERVSRRAAVPTSRPRRRAATTRCRDGRGGTSITGPANTRLQVARATRACTA